MTDPPTLYTTDKESHQMKRSTRQTLKQLAYIQEYENWFLGRPQDRWPSDAAPTDDWLRVWSNEPARTQLNPEVADWFETATVELKESWLIATSNGVSRLFRVSTDDH